ncbi:MAG: divergent PAP2 family protein [Synechococcales cyanobacterium RM1_1_8]|nr:divergent PAP2 family protein [Synechococcales cyanobacterium RM1_1_8]
MQTFGEIFRNSILLNSFLACFLAQAIKGIVDVIQHGKLDFRAVLGSGGMPSSHSALVTALATGVGENQGWSSAEFAMATVFAVIVMYDATGVRQAAGKQAKLLNQIIEELFHDEHHFNEERLKELLGHTPVQVLAGCALGITVALVAALL